MILCGDIGATKSLLGLAEARGGAIHIKLVRRYENREWPGFGELVDDFLAEAAAARGEAVELTVAGFGIAGPVGPDGVHMTNLDWYIGPGPLRSVLGGAPVRLLNDFEASALGIGDLGGDGCLPLQPAPALSTAPQLVIGAGSGLGVALRVPTANGVVVVPGEGGHVGYAPRNEEQLALWRQLRAGSGRLSVEHVVSGPGLGRIYEWLAETRASTGPCGELVWERAVEGNLHARHAIDLFLDSYGAVAGDFALATLARGGVYLTGGIGPRLLTAPAAAARFLAAFRDKAPHGALMTQMPVHLVVDDKLPLLGAARAATDLLPTA
ncbi:glucokinase [Azoarcus olearius]|uniref:Glucokinase n=1 Tax=Azoarcus sp. (strain BH72) TaxID=418699 RepID=A1K6G2_AZOSB|nr:glucokinase [Azoarcus olearius]CAL94417.1 putative glucokinase [Azoarcus olearius]